MRKQESEVQNPPLRGRRSPWLPVGWAPSLYFPLSLSPGSLAGPQVVEAGPSSPATRAHCHPHPRHTHTHAKQLGMSWLPGLPVEDDWECRLWEEMTIFIVWIKYFSWLSCCLLSRLFSPNPILSHSLPFLLSPLPLTRFLPQQSSTHREISRWKTPRVGRAVLGDQWFTKPFAVLIPRLALYREVSAWSRAASTLLQVFTNAHDSPGR